MWSKLADGTVVDRAGRVIFFSTERFIADICAGDCCLVCGVSPACVPFNNEHVLPEWLLRHFGLFGRTITLPNGAAVRYDRYSVPCCAKCNDLLGRDVEQPISAVVKRGSAAINDFIRAGYGLNLIVWMSLLFLKTHLKDRLVRKNLDLRNGGGPVAAGYEWEVLHHLHCVARCFYTGCEIEPAAVGSILVLPIRSEGSVDRFDYADLYLPQAMLVRFDDVAVVAVLNDAGGSMGYFHNVLERIKGPVSHLQLREIMVELAWLNLHLKERPTFRTEMDLLRETARICVKRPVLALAELDRRIRGELLHHAVKDALPQVRARGLSGEEIEAAVQAGRFTFLFDEEGSFITGTSRDSRA